MTLFQAFGQFAGQAAVPAVTPGMVLVSPTSITHSGTSATLGANGQVTFTAVTSLSLNGCFTADFDNYVIAIQADASQSGLNPGMRLRASGADNSTASSYVYQRLTATSTSVGGGRTTSDKWEVFKENGTLANGSWIYIYGPFLAQPTALRDVHVSSRDNAYLVDHAATHNQSTSYDGFTIYPLAGNITGTLTVMGVRS